MGWHTFNYGFIIYYALWPLCDFSASYLNFKTILSKDEYVLADAISFNIITAVKSLILFIAVHVTKIVSSSTSNCLQPIEYLWLSMIIASLLIFIVQIMLRARFIALTGKWYIFGFIFCYICVCMCFSIIYIFIVL